MRLGRRSLSLLSEWRADLSSRGPLSREQLHQYWHDGYVITEGLLDPQRLLDPVIEEVDHSVDVLARQLLKEGKIRNAHEDKGFLRRLSFLEQEFSGASVILHTQGILTEGIATLWSSRELLSVARQILGNDQEISGHPVWNLRCKTPRNALATVPFHQDTAYLGEGSERTHQLTAWVPLVDAYREMGCLQVIRGGHLSGEVLPHHLEKSRADRDSGSWYLYIQEEDLPEGEVVTCEVKKGDVLWLNNLIPHASTENYSDKIRWSLDLRWQRSNDMTGFEHTKAALPMVSPKDPLFKFDWKSWSSAKTTKREIGDKVNVSGPWLDRWRTHP